MRIGLVSCAAVLCALPAHGDTPSVSNGVINALMPLDSLPVVSALDTALAAPPGPLTNLVNLATSRTVDAGVSIRAIRSLPLYCPPTTPCGTGTVVHDRLVGVIDDLRGPLTPQDQLRLRAAVEALGATHSGLATDVSKLTPLLGNASRDVRATAVRALINVCNSNAIDLLLGHYSRESSSQVQAEITGSIDDLRQCAH